MEFTKEEISLCKQVAEKYKKNIKKGDWIIDDTGEICLIENIDKKDDTMMVRYGKNIGYFTISNPDTVPLWTISDCLEFFNERAFYLEGLCQLDECEYECCISELDDLGIVRGTRRTFEGETPLEACLKAVLAVCVA